MPRRAAALLALVVAAPYAWAMSSVEIAVRAGDAWASGTVTVERVDDGHSTPVASGDLADGRFRSDLPAGRYRIQVNPSDGSPSRQLAPFALGDREAQAFYVNLKAE